MKRILSLITTLALITTAIPTLSANCVGKLGNGTIVDSYNQIQLTAYEESLKASAKKVKQVALGEYHSAAVTEDGCLYMWGENSDGQLGNGKSGGTYGEYNYGIDSATPIKIMENVACISLGGNFSGAVTNDRQLYMWGNNDFGQLGNGTCKASSVPVKVMDNVVAVSVSAWTSAAITSNGSLYLWGENFHGQLGNGLYGGNEYFDGYDDGIDSNVPVKIMDNVSYVSLSDGHSAAITTDGSLYMWGWNMFGQLGTGTHGGSYHEFTEGSDRCVPTKLMDNVISVSLGASISGAVTVDNTLYMWGSNYYGGLGIGVGGTREHYNSFDETLDRDVPTKAMDNVASVNLGGNHSAAITTDGSLYMWGQNYHGQLGNESTKDEISPIKIMDSVLSADLGDDTSAAVKKDGSLWLWGSNCAGQLGDGGKTKESLVPILITIPGDSVSPYLLGDSNANGVVDIDDAILTLKYAMNTDIGDETLVLEAADVTDDGEISLDDAIEILKIAMKVNS